jgi:hypothetical protein
MSQKQNGSSGRMAIELSRTVNVLCFHIVGEVGFAQRRDELRAVTQLAAQRAGQLTARMICEHLLGNKPEAVGLRLLVVCERMGLIEWETKVRRGDAVARLTEEGRRVAEGGDVFVPERGTWTVWVAEDPLIPVVERLLRVEPFREPTAFDEVVGKKDKPREERRTVDLPEWVQEACSVYGSLGWGDGRAISMLDIEDQGEPEKEAGAQITLTLRAAPGEVSSIKLSGTIQSRRTDYELKDAPAPAFDEVWRYCLGSRAGDWDGRRLAVRFDNLSDTERNTFESHIAFDSWRHPVHGTFGRFQVPHVPLRPATDIDASLWANWLLAYRTQSYVRKADFARRCEEVQETFTGYRLQLMTQEQLATSLRRTSVQRPSRKYWHLQAPLDWSL